MRRLKRLLIVSLTLFLLLTVSSLLYARFIAPSHFTVKRNIISSEKISEDLDGLTILYFSDLHLNEFMTQTRFDKLVDKINQQKPDVILFGGDLVADSFENNTAQEAFLESMKRLEAPFGKFAVLGELEIETSTTLTNVNLFYQQANFEVLSNKSTKLYYHRSSHAINLIGIDEDFESRQELDNSYTIAFTHHPNNANKISVDLMIASHIHGGQLNLAFARDRFIDNQKFTKSTQQVGLMRLDISNGVGTTYIDMRLFAPAQINLYTFKAK